MDHITPNPYVFKEMTQLAMRDLMFVRNGNKKILNYSLPSYHNSTGNVFNIYDNIERKLFLRTSKHGVFSWQKIKSIVLDIYG